MSRNRSLIHFIMCTRSDFDPAKGPSYISFVFIPGTCLCNGSFHVQETLLSGKNEPEKFVQAQYGNLLGKNNWSHQGIHWMYDHIFSTNTITGLCTKARRNYTLTSYTQSGLLTRNRNNSIPSCVPNKFQRFIFILVRYKVIFGLKETWK